VGWGAGPDVWDLNVAVPSDCCPSDNLLHTTFATCACRMQAYPDTHPNQLSPGFTGAEEIDTLGYSHDSVYDMSFTFYHHQSDLRLSFAGSPLLQGVLDESWGIDNIEVAVDAESCCRAVRTLPEVYGGGTSVPVTIDVVPNPGAQAVIVLENPPFGWPVTDVTEGGVVDSGFRDHPIRSVHRRSRTPAVLQPGRSVRRSGHSRIRRIGFRRRRR
jgi:hypothetical protein